MALGPKSPSHHNRLMGTRIPHPSSTNYHDGNDFPSPPAKRPRTAATNNTSSPQRGSPRKAPPKKILRDEIPDSDDEAADLGVKYDDAPPSTQLEATLPPVQTDEEAIEAYEAYKAGEEDLNNQEASDASTTQARLESRTWIRGRSSIYVDAFNLALDTVLEDEGHLFNEAEHDLFRQWRELNYEAQYLYVRLFLRKTSKWFRIRDLQYYSDVADMDVSVADLQRDRTLPTVETEPDIHPGELEPPDGTVLGESFRFAECSSELITTLDEASSLLLLDELKELAKDVKVKGKNKRELLQNFRRTSGRQSGLSFKERRRSETEDSTGGTAMSEDNRSVYDEDGDVDDEGKQRIQNSHHGHPESRRPFHQEDPRPHRPLRASLADAIETLRASPPSLLPQHRMDGEESDHVDPGQDLPAQLSGIYR